jgi:hypothetical protein
MVPDSLPSPLPMFHSLGDQAAALLLQAVGVTIKAIAGYHPADPEDHDLSGGNKTHYQLRSGPRGRLSKPPVTELAEAIQLFIEQGPDQKVSVYLPELLLSAAMSLSGDPHRELLEPAFDSVEDASFLHQIRDRPQDEKTESENKVIPFPSRSVPK